MFFTRPFASAPRRHDAAFPAAFSFAPWHLLGGLNASSAAISLTNRSTLLSIALASPVVEQGGLDSAFVNAPENLVSQAVTFAVSTRTALAADFERTLSRHPAFLPAAFIFAAWHFSVCAHAEPAASQTSAMMPSANEHDLFIVEVLLS